jgi:hypothetical protein
MPRTLDWRFPLPRTHTGMLQGNGVLGLTPRPDPLRPCPPKAISYQFTVPEIEYLAIARLAGAGG